MRSLPASRTCRRTRSRCSPRSAGHPLLHRTRICGQPRGRPPAGRGSGHAPHRSRPSAAVAHSDDAAVRHRGGRDHREPRELAGAARARARARHPGLGTRSRRCRARRARGRSGGVRAAHPPGARTRAPPRRRCRTAASLRCPRRAALAAHAGGRADGRIRTRRPRGRDVRVTDDRRRASCARSAHGLVAHGSGSAASATRPDGRCDRGRTRHRSGPNRVRRLPGSPSHRCGCRLAGSRGSARRGPRATPRRRARDRGGHHRGAAHRRGIPPPAPSAGDLGAPA